jgi:hypothetical protein
MEQIRVIFPSEQKPVAANCSRARESIIRWVLIT